MGYPSPSPPDHFLRSKVVGGRPRRLRDDFVMILVDFDLLWGSPGDHFGEHLGARVSTWSVYVFFCVVFGVSKKGAKQMPKVIKKSPFGGGQHGSSVVSSGPN